MRSPSPPLRSPRRWGLGLVLVAVLGTAGCGIQAGSEAQEAADRLFPGQVTVLSTEGRGGLGGRSVTAALRDDPDAVVRWAVTDGCDPGSRCEDDLRAAVPRARAEATELRALTGTFRDCGYPLVGVRSIVANSLGVTAVATASATVDDSRLVPLGAELDRCIARWSAGRGAAGVRRVHLDLDIVEPSVAIRAPAPDPSLPTQARLDDDDLFAALTERSRYRASVRIDRPDLGGQAPPVARILYPERTFADQQAFDAPVLEAARRWAIAAGNPARPVVVFDDGTRFVAGSTRRLQVVVSLCGPGPLASCGRGAELVFTVDPGGGAARDFRLVELPLDPDGTVVFPPAP